MFDIHFNIILKSKPVFQVLSSFPLGALTKKIVLHAHPILHDLINQVILWDEIPHYVTIPTLLLPSIF